MRPVVLQMGITLDGFSHGAEGYEDWGLPPEDDELVAWKAASLREAGTHIMGRVTYQEMASVWPKETGVYAEVMNQIPKVVFSTTLASADWPESRIAGGDRTDRRVPAGGASRGDRPRHQPVCCSAPAAAAGSGRVADLPERHHRLGRPARGPPGA